MRRGGGGHGGVVLWALLSAPACGLVVGFEPRDLCDDCSSSTGGADGSGGSNSPSAGADSNAGGATSTGGSGANGTGGVENAGAVGGSSGNTAGDGSGTSGGSGGASSSGTDSDATDSGGMDGSGGSTTSTTDAGNGGVGGTTTDSGGAGGNDAVSNSAGGTSGGSEVGGTGGGGAGGSGGATTSTATTAAGASTTGGGDGGSGGTGGTPSCDVDEPFDVTNDLGAYPAALMVGRSSGSRLWDFTWVAGDKAYVAARGSDGSVALEPQLLDSIGALSPSVIATQSADAFVAYGEFASGDARIVVNQLNPLDPAMVSQFDAEILDAEAAPQVVAMAFKGTSNAALVASIDADGAGLLSWFEAGNYQGSHPVPGTIDDLVAVDLGADFAIAYVEEDSLKVTVVPYAFDGLGEIEAGVEVSGAVPSAPSLGSIGAAPLSNGAALVWLEGNGVFSTTIDEDGEAEAKVLVASGGNLLPRVAAKGTGLFVSWINEGTDTLYLQRFPSGLTDSPEKRIEVAKPVAEVSYGFAVDTFSAKPTVAFVYSAERLRMKIIDCD